MEIKFEFIIDNKFLSQSYTLDELIKIGEEGVIENMEVCNCHLTESNSMCEGDCIKFEDSQITGKRQYTGLTDKVGKEIYGGDIVEFLYKNPEQSGKLLPVRCEIFWHEEGAWCLKWHGKQPYLNGARLTPEKYAVVGNIFQNPDYLK